MSSTSSSVMSQRDNDLGCDRTHKPKKKHHVLICLWFDCTIVPGLPKAIHSEPCITQRVSGVSFANTAHWRARHQDINQKQCVEAHDKPMTRTTCNEPHRESTGLLSAIFRDKIISGGCSQESVFIELAAVVGVGGVQTRVDCIRRSAREREGMGRENG